jgi:hypothetical protein
VKENNIKKNDVKENNVKENNVKEKFHTNFVTLLDNKILTLLNEKQEHKSLSIKQVPWFTAELHVSVYSETIISYFFLNYIQENIKKFIGFKNGVLRYVN